MSNSDVRIEIIDDVSRWEALANDWNALCNDRPFRRFEWLRGWWSGYRQSRQLRIIRVVGEDQSTRAILPLHKYKGPAGTPIQAFLGSGKACSDELSVLLKKESDIESLTAIAESLIDQARCGEWDVLKLDGFGLADRAMSTLIVLLREAGLRHLTEYDQSCWRTELCGSWDAYLALLSKRARRLVRAHARRFEAGEATLAIAGSEAECDSFFHQIADFHQRRWEAVGVSGCFGDAQFREFLADAVRRMWQAGTARLGLVSHGGQPISGSIGMVLGGVHTLYLVGNDPDYSRLQPGWALNTAILRDACNERLNAVDFVRGDENYKARLGARPRRQIRVRFYSDSLRARTNRGLATIKLAVGSLADAIRVQS